MTAQEKNILSLIYEQLSAVQRYNLALTILQNYQPTDDNSEAPNWWQNENELADTILSRSNGWKNGEDILVEPESVFSKIREELNQ